MYPVAIGDSSEFVWKNVEHVRITPIVPPPRAIHASRELALQLTAQ